MRQSPARSIVACLAVCGILAAAGSAQAASPVITIDSSPLADKPAVAVAPDGTAHIAWQRGSGDSTLGDELHYCRLPRGAKGCDRQETFVPDDGKSFGRVSVLARDDGRIQIVEGRCCFSDDRTILVESPDGGSTFSAPRQIGTTEGGDAIAGPGPNAITATQGGAASGRSVAVQVMATDAGVTSAVANLEDGDGRWYPGGVGLIDSSTPIFAYGDLTNTYIRRFDATKPNYNDGASWLPSTTIPNEDEGRIVTGSAGTYVMTRTVNAKRVGTYRVRRVSQTDGTLGEPTNASDSGDPIFATIAADQGNGLTSVWTVPSGGDGAPIYARGAPSGGAFSKTGILVTKAPAFNLKAATAPDHGGFVVWDGNSAGKVSAAAIPAGGVTPTKNPGGTGAGCTTDPKTIRKDVVATVSNGCWNSLGGSRFDTVGDVNVNGITFATDGKKTKVTIDTAKHTIKADSGVVEKAGSIVLAKDAVTWDLDTGPKTFDHLEKAGTGGKPILLFDFPVVGQADVTFVAGGAKVGVNMQMPKPFDSVTGRSVLSIAPGVGLKREGTSIHVTNASIGPFVIRQLDVTFNAGLSTFVGQAKFVLPPDGGEIDAGFAFKDGSLEAINASVIGVEPLPFPITPTVWLKAVGFSYSKVGGFRIGGGAQFDFPTREGPFELDALGSPPGTGGGFEFFIPSGKSYADMTLAARLKVFGLDIGGFVGTFRTTGLFWFNADLSIGVPGVVGIFGTAAGKFDLPQKSFYAKGMIEACVLLCIGAEATASNIGVSVCPVLEFGIDPLSFKLTFLVGYKFKGGLTAGAGCDQGPFLPAASGAPPTGTGSDAKVTLKAADIVQVPPPADDPYTIGMEIQGNGGLPAVRITDVLSGQTIVQSDPSDPTKPVQQGDVVLVPNASTNSVRLIALRRDDAFQFGTEWRIEQAGGAPIAFRRAAPNGARNANGTRATVSGISFAREYAETKVTARLGGTGRKRTISYTATNLAGPGRTVEFVEVGARGDDGAAKVLGTTKQAKGKLSFTIFDGPAGLRRIEARVRNYDGLAVDSQTVASYRAPGPVLPTRATRIRLKRDAKGRLKVTWKGTSGAARRVVFVTVADGRRLRFDVKKTTVTIPGVDKKEKVTVKIRGLTKLGREGPAATARR